MLLTILWYFGVGIISLILFLLVSLAILVQVAHYQAQKFMFEMPWLKWLTLDDLKQLGFSRTWARLLLPLFHEKGYLEVRLIDEDGMDYSDHAMVAQFGFGPATVPLYEFKCMSSSSPSEKA